MPKRHPAVPRRLCARRYTVTLDVQVQTGHTDAYVRETIAETFGPLIEGSLSMNLDRGSLIAGAKVLVSTIQPNKEKDQ